ncbi:MAG: hypothetical protein SGI77_03590 [Pirellulaceae bacterium]|nr:hypothetical protein [Pirellulaceae bacterium]
MPVPRIDGHETTFDEAISFANQLLADRNRSHISGAIRSVEAARAVLALASRVGAYVDPTGSDDAFKTILAIQRQGMMTASMSEVRFRSDCIVLIGDDRLLQSFPRLIEILLQRPKSSPQIARRRIIALGPWTSEVVARLRNAGLDVSTIDIQVLSIPQSLFQWSRCNEESMTKSSNLVSRWLCEARYLSLVWSATIIDQPQADLWVERLFQWIVQRNNSHRCVGLPLSGGYVTFQQVCTWITGFPGRVLVDGDAFTYDPYRNLLSDQAIVRLHIDETTIADESAAGRQQSTIVIAPKLHERNPMPRVFIPCSVAGIDQPATFFRADAAVAIEAMDCQLNSSTKRFMSVPAILERLGVAKGC